MRFIHHPSHLHPRTGRLKLIVQVLIAGFLWLGGRLTAEELFEMERIRDPKTLNAIIEQDWHLVPGSLETRQKLISINVGELGRANRTESREDGSTGQPSSERVSPHWWEYASSSKEDARLTH